MTVLAQLFVATHAQAVSRATALDAGKDPAQLPYLELELGDATDLEHLGDVAARAVRFGSGDLELTEVDLDHERLLRLPDFMCEALTELSEPDDPELPGEVAAAWADRADLDVIEDDVAGLVHRIVALVAAAQETGLDVYVWTPE